MAKTPRRRVSARPQAGPAAAPAAAAHASRTAGEDRRPAGGLSPGSLSAAPRPGSRRRNPFGWLSKLQPRFAADVISELRKVTWPSFSDTRYLTFVVAVVAILVGLILGSFDLAFGWIIERLFFD